MSEEPTFALCALADGRNRAIPGGYKLPCDGCGRMLLVAPSTILAMTQHPGMKLFCKNDAAPHIREAIRRGELQFQPAPGAREELIMAGIPENEVDAVFKVLFEKKGSDG